jgi:AcrR family transcriptional regulator
VRKKRVTNRQLQAIKTKNRIFKSAVALIDEHEYENVTIEDISNKAGVSVGAFYHYYKSKSDIMLELYMEIDGYYEDTVVPLLVSDDVFDNIRIFFTHYADYQIEKGYNHVKHLFATHNRLFVDKSRTIYSSLREVLERGGVAGQITQQYSIEEIENCYFVLARGVVYDWILHEGDYDLVERMLVNIGALEICFKR